MQTENGVQYAKEASGLSFRSLHLALRRMRNIGLRAADSVMSNCAPVCLKVERRLQSSLKHEAEQRGPSGGHH